MFKWLTDRLVAMSLRQLGRILRHDGLEQFGWQSGARARGVNPSTSDSLYAEARASWEEGKLPEARALLEGLLSINPSHVAAINLLGVIHLFDKNFVVAEALFRQAIDLAPDLAPAHCNLGNILLEREDFIAAESHYRAALDCAPEYVEAHNNLGLALQEQDRLDEAIASYGKALSITPDYVGTYLNLAGTLQRQGKLDLALANIDKALSIKPNYAEALNNRGVLLAALKRFDQALLSYAEALSINPYYADAHYNEGLCRLRMGDFEHGWEKYEWRWELGGSFSGRRDFPKPLWLGREDIAGKTILLHSEQGLGDTIQFCRYAKLVAALGATVLMEVSPSLKSLLATMEGVNRIMSYGESLPAFDYHCRLLSLPLALKTSISSIPSNTPYLHPDPSAVKVWGKRLAGIEGLRVGLVWAGNPQYEYRGHFEARLRSIPLSAFQSLRALKGVQFFSIQKGEPSAQISQLRAANWSGPELIDFTDELDDFSDTAAFTACLDLVISCDTSMAHLAGAIGKPVWILIRFNGCWRWLTDREDSPWYPTARLFRQPKIGDWDSVITKVKHELAALCEPN